MPVLDPPRGHEIGKPRRKDLPPRSRRDRRTGARAFGRARASHHSEPLRPPRWAGTNLGRDRKAHEPEPRAGSSARARSEAKASRVPRPPARQLEVLTGLVHRIIPPAVAAGIPPIPPLLPAAAAPL